MLTVLYCTVLFFVSFLSHLLAAAAMLLGQGGAVAMLILLFLAVTSAASAEIIAVSSILTFDVYKTYINPRATPRQIVNVGHAAIAFYALFMGGG
jgi:Na+/proline symporter